MTTEHKKRLEYLRRELRAERISYGELAELADLKDHIAPGDVELLEAAGVPEFEELHKLYECGICGMLHPWDWSGDCREDENRYGDEQEYAERNGLSRAEYLAIEVFSWEERQEADRG